MPSCLITSGRFSSDGATNANDHDNHTSMSSVLRHATPRSQFFPPSTSACMHLTHMIIHMITHRINIISCIDRTTSISFCLLSGLCQFIALPLSLSVVILLSIFMSFNHILVKLDQLFAIVIISQLHLSWGSVPFLVFLRHSCPEEKRRKNETTSNGGACVREIPRASNPRMLISELLFMTYIHSSSSSNGTKNEK